MVDVAQLVRASDCGSESRGFEPHLPPKKKAAIGNLFSFNPNRYLISPENVDLNSSQGVLR